MEMSRIGCFILALSLAGCGPVIATSNIIQADAALEEARSLNAQANLRTLLVPQRKYLS